MGLLETFSKTMRSSCREGGEIFVLQVSAAFSSDGEPQERVARAMFSSTVRPYLVDGTAVFVN